jgi:hypothetical protein
MRLCVLCLVPRRHVRRPQTAPRAAATHHVHWCRPARCCCALGEWNSRSEQWTGLLLHTHTWAHRIIAQGQHQRTWHAAVRPPCGNALGLFEFKVLLAQLTAPGWCGVVAAHPHTLQLPSPATNTPHTTTARTVVVADVEERAHRAARHVGFEPAHALLHVLLGRRQQAACGGVFVAWQGARATCVAVVVGAGGVSLVVLTAGDVSSHGACCQRTSCNLLNAPVMRLMGDRLLMKPPAPAAPAPAAPPRPGMPAMPGIMPGGLAAGICAQRRRDSRRQRGRGA